MITDVEIRELDDEAARASSTGELTASLRAISNYCAIALSASYSDDIRHRARVYLAAVLESRRTSEGSVVMEDHAMARGTPH